MKVEELIIDGFKSYATRTVISDWDESFNCITGLNGSGKSNILDAICFVLGITAMTTVRAQNIQDLIYKRGQAGVTKASVTIVFDNSDKSKGPIGFEDQARISVTRQIVLGGTSKFLINGHRAQQQTVQALFQSVQLNINNPNFLIMQGRITKVLNMKPQETLALIEEAAGTRMFEERREKAIKTMAKKEKKVEEILALLAEEIEPKLETLRTEKRTFVEFQQTRTGYERVSKLVCAHDHDMLIAKVEEVKRSLDSQTSTFDMAQAEIEQNKLEISDLDSQAAALKKQLEDQMQKGGKFQALEKKVKLASQETARIKTLLELKQANIAEEVDAASAVAQSIATVNAKMLAGKSRFDQSSAAHAQVESQLEQLNAELSKKDELLRSLTTGVSSKQGQGLGYASQLEDARVKVNQAQTRVGTAKVKLAGLKKALNQDEAKTAKSRKALQQLESSLESMQAQAHTIKMQLESAGFRAGRMDELKARETTLQAQIRKTSAQVDTLQRQVANVDFHYSPPSSADFDPKGVKGLVAQLFTLDEKHYDASTALEICAGGRLYNVVVDTDVTSAQLLEPGVLKRRVTIIPLNKISAFRLSAERLGAAKAVAPGKCELALNLIGHDASVLRAMEYVFGSTIVCKDAESAKKITFDPQIRAKTVTLEGDVFDPSGTLTGGSNSKGGKGTSEDLLVTIQRYNRLRGEVKELQQELNAVRHEMGEEEGLGRQFQTIKKQLDLKEHEIELAQKELKSGNHAQNLEKYKQRVAESDSLRQQVSEDEAIINTATVEAQQIERDASEFQRNKGGKLQELKEQIDGLQKSIAAAQKHMLATQDKHDAVQMEAAQLQGDLESYQEQLEEKQSAIQEMKGQLTKLEGQLSAAKEEEERSLQQLHAEQSKFTGLNQELDQLKASSAAKRKIVTEAGLECQRLRHSLDKLAQDMVGYKARLDTLLKENEAWIEDQRHLFGKVGTAYAYQTADIAQCRAEYKRLGERLKSMRNIVNPKVLNMIESVEKKEAALRTMLQTIEKDKAKIEQTIGTLNEYKTEALLKTYTKVSEDFGTIFGDLLPGGFAKLVTLEGKDITEGLEVKVRLGKVWKEGLAELSGGQRSLIALSLILALLQFKPAPMYILDEVDAALDLHHTQNIGHIIKTRFQGSQFIVVSLKEGMFTNANRVFRARFHEGTSTVSSI